MILVILRGAKDYSLLELEKIRIMESLKCQNQQSARLRWLIGYLVKSVDKPKQDNLVYDRNDIAPTITAASTYYYIEDKGSFRRLVPEELWGISGYSKEDWEKIKSFSDFRIDQFIGNSIALGPLKAIYSNLKEAFNWEEN